MKSIQQTIALYLPRDFRLWLCLHQVFLKNSSAINTMLPLFEIDIKVSFRTAALVNHNSRTHEFQIHNSLHYLNLSFKIHNLASFKYVLLLYRRILEMG